MAMAIVLPILDWNCDDPTHKKIRTNGKTVQFASWMECLYDINEFDCILMESGIDGVCDFFGPLVISISGWWGKDMMWFEFHACYFKNKITYLFQK